MKRYWPMIIVLAVLLAAYFLIEAPFVDKRYTNPIGENVTALEFRLADGSGTYRLEDPEIIDRLRSAYRWTNYHMYCCLAPQATYARVYEVVGEEYPREPIKVYNSLAVPSFNLEFRLLLKKVCDEMVNN